MAPSEARTREALLDARHEKLRRAAAAVGVECVITTSVESFAYLTRTWIASFPLLSTRRVFAVVSTNSHFSVASSLQASDLRNQGLEDIVVYGADDEDPTDALVRAVRDRELTDGAIALELDCLPKSVEDYLMDGLRGAGEIVDATPLLQECRARKDQAELEELVAIGKTVADASLYAASETRAGETEIDLARRISEYAAGQGASDGVLVVGSGWRTALTHPSPTDKVLRSGDVVRVDVVRRSPFGYFGDIARTMFVGEPTRDQAARFDTAAAGLLASIEALRPGRPVKEAYQACRAAFAERGYELAFPHVGHSVGIGAHEEPLITARCEIETAPGMTFCIEPILQVDTQEWYHLEHLVHVTDSGAEPLQGSWTDVVTIQA
jgi:Xaa-Pro aminopeptidase